MLGLQRCGPWRSSSSGCGEAARRSHVRAAPVTARATPPPGTSAPAHGWRGGCACGPHGRRRTRVGAANSGAGSSRRFAVLNADEAAWYWGPISALAADDDEPSPPSPCPPTADAAAEAARAAEVSRRVREAEGLGELLELAEAEAPRMALGDVRRLLLRRAFGI
ncbi:MAG: hypothetical protein J3K34DRAFT_411700 [Monoraphidium minutum]|nr:MAG: hypothetical protein J3K34DRAFT_411700 [Monoraphidium minutum]